VNIGLPEVLIFLLILLVIFGGRRIPELGRALGTGLRELRQHVGRGPRNGEEIDAGQEPSRPSAERVKDEEVGKGPG
jgi:sec-independent protein translocase protein TatA